MSSLWEKLTGKAPLIEDENEGNAPDEGKKAKKGKPVKEKPAKKDKKRGKDAPAEPVARPSESLGTVLDETVPAASLETIRGNGSFKVDSKSDSDHTCYLVMTLDVADIGGLNKHMKRDPNKGQFIECCSNRSIQYHASEENLAEGRFIIIPTHTTMMTLSEFSFISDSGRFSNFIPTLCYVDNHGDMQFEEIKTARVDFGWFAKVLKGETSVEDAVNEAYSMNNAPEGASDDEPETITAGEESVAGAMARSNAKKDKKRKGKAAPQEESNDEEEEVPEQGAEPEVGSLLGGMQMDMPEEFEDNEASYDDGFEGSDFSEGEEIPEGYDAGFAESVPEDMEDYPQTGFAPDDVPQTGFEMPVDDTEYIQNDGIETVQCPNCGAMMNQNETCPSCGFSFGNSQEETAEEQSEYEEISDVDISSSYERLFHAGDLDLQITPQPFDVQFIQGNEFVPIPENREDTWLNGYVTQMIKTANSELSRIHKKNLFLARERYLSLMTKACEEIAHRVDLNDPSNPYHKMKKVIQQDADAKKEGLEQEVDKRRNMLIEDWNNELSQIEKSAAARARESYLEKHTKAHESALRNVEIMLSDEIDIEYNKALTELNEKRKIEAKRLLDIHTTETLVVMHDNYQEMIMEEEARRMEYLEEINNFIDEHRKEEMARVSILDEELHQKDIASKVVEEFTRKIQSLSYEHDATCDKLYQEIEAAKTHEETIQRDFNAKIAELRNKNNDAEKRYNELMDKYIQIDNENAQKYESRMETLENDKKAAEEHLAHVDFVHNKYNKVSIIVWVAIAVATFAIGILIGAKFLGTSGGGSNGHYSISFTTEDGDIPVDDQTGSDTDTIPQDAPADLPVEGN